MLLWRIHRRGRTWLSWLEVGVGHIFLGDLSFFTFAEFLAENTPKDGRDFFKLYTDIIWFPCLWLAKSASLKYAPMIFFFSPLNFERWTPMTLWQSIGSLRGSLSNKVRSSEVPSKPTVGCDRVSIWGYHWYNYDLQDWLLRRLPLWIW